MKKPYIVNSYSEKTNTYRFYYSRLTKMNGHLLGFYQLVQNLEWITPITATQQKKQNE